MKYKHISKELIHYEESIKNQFEKLRNKGLSDFEISAALNIKLENLKLWK